MLVVRASLSHPGDIVLSDSHSSHILVSVSNTSASALVLMVSTDLIEGSEDSDGFEDSDGVDEGTAEGSTDGTIDSDGVAEGPAEGSEDGTIDMDGVDEGATLVEGIGLMVGDMDGDSEQ
jgi:hypothetical protein